MELQLEQGFGISINDNFLNELGSKSPWYWGHSIVQAQLFSYVKILKVVVGELREQSKAGAWELGDSGPEGESSLIWIGGKSES